MPARMPRETQTLSHRGGGEVHVIGAMVSGAETARAEATCGFSPTTLSARFFASPVRLEHLGRASSIDTLLDDIWSCDHISHMAGRRLPRPDLEPLNQPEVRKLIREILLSGDVEFSAHAQDEMRADRLESTDCVNVLRGGTPGGAEYVNREWRYSVGTRRICVVITFLSERRLRVVTAWRNQE